ncbi:MAG TPA: 2-hydroxyacyl-CoA dehydratase, partial [Phycisphaerae bacterium]|nr:2-hydroxyacyl-CoA dehydratase [Phycisphaerae bacterium]
IGLTATVPVEVLLAAGAEPMDLNNVFITSEDPRALVAEAQRRSFPANSCAWIKGIYATARRLGVRRVIGVAQGDCSSTGALMEIFASEGIEVIEFNYPYPKEAAALEEAIERLARRLGTTRKAAESERRRLHPVRRTLAEVDRLTWQENKVTGEENHRWLVGASDFGGDPEVYRREAEAFLAEARGRQARTDRVRLGCLGIPPIASGLHEFLEARGAHVVFNEFQRQFSMLSAVADPPTENLVEQYLAYTYPYGVNGRIEDIRRAVRERRLGGLVHYVQTFCFRGIQDRLLREAADVPVLTVEFDRPGPPCSREHLSLQGPLDAQSRTRLEAFVEMLQGRAGAPPFDLAQGGPSMVEGPPEGDAS